MSQLCRKLHHLFQSLRIFNYPLKRDQIPLNGIYILFETGESAHGTRRIVRIGTHRGDNRLWPRIKLHFVKENKDQSIFRKNIGRAILSRNQDPFLRQWEINLNSREAKKTYGPTIDSSKQKLVEAQVTEYMRNNFSLVVLEVKDQSKRLEWESKIISTVSLCDECHPSPEWLGLHSPILKIRKSGLWNVNELYKQPIVEAEYEELQALVTGNL